MWIVTCGNSTQVYMSILASFSSFSREHLLNTSIKRLQKHLNINAADLRGLLPTSEVCCQPQAAANLRGR